MAGQLLSRFRRGSTHREMRAERVSQLVDVAGHGKATGSLRAFHPAPEGVLAHRLRVALVENPRPLVVPIWPHQSDRAIVSWPRLKSAIGQIERDDLASPKPRGHFGTEHEDPVVGQQRAAPERRATC